MLTDAAPKCLDLFAGVGGWSSGARAAGAKVAVAVDGSFDVVSVLKTNFPEAQVLTVKLPDEQLIDKIPLDIEYIMASPPCTLLSRARSGTTAGETHGALEMVEWTLDLIDRIRRRPGQLPFVWVLENVGHRQLQSRLEKRKNTPGKDLDWGIFEMGELAEVPQCRKRLIAGTPAIIRKLTALPKRPPTPAATVFDAGTLSEADHLKATASTIGSDGVRTPCLRSLNLPAFAVVAGHPHTLCTSNGTTVRVCSTREQARLQTLPDEHILPKGSRQAITAIGNCVPPAFAKVVSEIAIQVLREGRAMAAAPAPVPPDEDTAEADLREQVIGLKKRLREVETVLRNSGMMVM
jgi:DNA (cytosine-5)-methyltransferase 1